MRICFVGDSLVNGYGDDEFLGWTGRLCREERKKGTDITFYNLGVRGDTSDDIRKRWSHESAVRLPEGEDPGIAFSFGVNDVKLEDGRQKVDADRSAENVRKILGAAADLYPVIFIGPPPVEDRDHCRRIKGLSEMLRDICSELDVPCLDIYSILSENAEWTRDVSRIDGVHPSSGGYGLIAREILKWYHWRRWFDK